MAEQISPEEFAALLAQRVEQDPKYANISKRLRELIWNSECNDLNIKLYDRLQREAIIHGPDVYRAIRSVAASALTKSNPVRYFAASITRRLNEMGYLSDGSEDLNL